MDSTANWLPMSSTFNESHTSFSQASNVRDENQSSCIVDLSLFLIILTRLRVRSAEQPVIESDHRILHIDVSVGYALKWYITRSGLT